jgi:hypothetical protein
MAVKQESEAEAHPEAVDKLAFSAIAAPDSSNASDLTAFSTHGSPTTKKEVWSYYAFYAADNGIGTFQ